MPEAGAKTDSLTITADAETLCRQTKKCNTDSKKAGTNKIEEQITCFFDALLVDKAYYTTALLTSQRGAPTAIPYFLN